MNSPFMMMALVADGTLNCGWVGGGVYGMECMYDGAYTVLEYNF